MSTQMIHIEYEASEGALLRLIGLVERRGFDVASMELAARKDQLMKLELGLNPRQPSNDIQILKRQIHRLIGVCNVQNGAMNAPANKGGPNDRK